MKKLALLLCFLLCTCLLAGCGGQPATSTDGDASTETTTAAHTASTTAKDGTTSSADGTTTAKDGTTTTAKDGVTTTTAATTVAVTTVAGTTKPATTTTKKDTSKGDSLMSADIDDPLAAGSCTANHDTLYNAGKNMDSFLFYTDAHHAMWSYWKNTVDDTFKFMKDKLTKTGATFIVDGGDWLGSGDTLDQAIEKLTHIYDKRAEYGLADTLHFSVGNHDTNYQGTEILPNKTIANIWFPEYKRTYYRFDSGKSSNYVLDSQLDAENDDTRAYIRKELKWLLIDRKKNNSEHINIFSHIIYNFGVLTDTAKDLGRIIKAYNERLVFDFYGTTYDFTASTGHIDLVMSGHTHSETSSLLGGVPSVNCGSFSQSTSGAGFVSYNVIKDYDNGKIHVYRLDTKECRCYDIK